MTVNLYLAYYEKDNNLWDANLVSINSKVALKNLIKNCDSLTEVKGVARVLLREEFKDYYIKAESVYYRSSIGDNE